MLSAKGKKRSASEIQLRLRLPLFWLAVCLVAAFILPDRIWNTLLIGIGGLFVTAYVWAKYLQSGLSGHREVQFGWVAVGDLLEEQFVLSNQSPLPAIWVEVLDQANVPGYRPATVRSVPARGVIRWRETAVCQQRGQYQLGPWQLRSSDPFGIFTVIHTFPVSNEIVIHPPIHTNIPIPLPSGQSSGQTRAQQTVHRATLNASSIRGYQPSDPFRWIHWPTSAKRQELFVKTFDLDAAGAIWICLDLRRSVQVGEGMDGTEEHAVVLAAALSAQALHQNRPIGLAGYGQIPQIVTPALGAEQRWRMLRALALVHADGETPLQNALVDLKRMARRGTAVVLITPDFQLDWIPQLNGLQRSGVQTHVTLLDQNSFGGIGKTDALEQDLQRIGVQTLRVQKGELGLAPEATQKNISYIVTGTGKAIMTRQ
ncbi:MAG: DUF58 domain-containing protein [Chloroflexota bacterium]